LQLKIDLHVHTNCSHDSSITPEELIYYAKKRGLDGVAVTDHDRLDGALRIAEESDFLIIPGVEVSSLGGHIVGLDVEKAIPKKLSVSETVDLMHEAGGIAVASHPSAFLKGSLRQTDIVSSRFDAVEVINASAFPFKSSVRHSQRIASNLHIASVAGSDAHYGPEIGCAYTVVDAEPQVDQIVEAIRKGACQPFGNAIPLRTRLKRELLILRRRLG
jgi:predicted metal-dependent phosphoesterase TrpH